MLNKIKKFLNFVSSTANALLTPIMDKKIQQHADLGHYNLTSITAHYMNFTQKNAIITPPGTFPSFTNQDALLFKNFGLHSPKMKSLIDGVVTLDSLRVACNFKEDDANLYLYYWADYKHCYNDPLANKSDNWKLLYYERLEAFLLLFKVREQINTAIQLTLNNWGRDQVSGKQLTKALHPLIKEFLTYKMETGAKVTPDDEKAELSDTRKGTYLNEAKYCSRKIQMLEPEQDHMISLAIQSKYCSRYIILSAAKSVCVLTVFVFHPIITLAALTALGALSFRYDSIRDGIMPVFYSRALDDYVGERGYVALIQEFATQRCPIPIYIA